MLIAALLIKQMRQPLPAKLAAPLKGLKTMIENLSILRTLNGYIICDFADRKPLNDRYFDTQEQAEQYRALYQFFKLGDPGKLVEALKCS